jgi:membrane-bound serine protease (ClpP class)
MEGLMGQVGEVRQPLEPEGLVLVEGELWKAESETGPTPVGEEVLITGYEGFKLRVRPIKPQVPVAGAPANSEQPAGQPTA